MKLEFKGYVKNPAVRTSAAGKPYNMFDVSSVTGKKQDGKKEYTYFRCLDFTGSKLPTPDAFVEVKGGLTIEKAEKSGVTYTNHTVFVDELTISPPRDDASPKPSAKKDAWDE